MCSIYGSYSRTHILPQLPQLVTAIVRAPFSETGSVSLRAAPLWSKCRFNFSLASSFKLLGLMPLRPVPVEWKLRLWLLAGLSLQRRRGQAKDSKVHGRPSPRNIFATFEMLREFKIATKFLRRGNITISLATIRVSLHHFLPKALSGVLHW